MASLALVSSDNYFRLVYPSESTSRLDLLQVFGPNTTDQNYDGSEAFHLYESLNTLGRPTVLSTTNYSANGTDLQFTKDRLWDPCHPENPVFNCSVSDFLEYYQGPQMISLFKAIMVSRSDLITG